MWLLWIVSSLLLIIRCSVDGAPSAPSDSSKKWKNIIVPYKLSSQIVHNPLKALNLEEAMEEISRRTCVKFVPHLDNQPDYVLFKSPPDPHCSAEIGRQGGRQIVTLGDDCFSRAIIQHQLMHVLGFIHEHNRPDRDDWVKTICKPNKGQNRGGTRPINSDV